MISDLHGTLGSLYFLDVANEGDVLHHAHAHLELPGCLIYLAALLTKKLPILLSCLNDTFVLR